MFAARVGPAKLFLVSLLACALLGSFVVACGSAPASLAPTPTLAPTSIPTVAPTPAASPTSHSTPKPEKATATPTVQQGPPLLELQPASMSITGDYDCKRATVYICMARVLAPASNGSALKWSAYTNMAAGVVFHPAHGVLAPGKSVIVTIDVPFTLCTTGQFFFQGPANTHSIVWQC